MSPEPRLARGLVRTHLVALALLATACGDASGPSEIPHPVRLKAARLAPVVTEAGQPFTLTLQITGASGPRIHAHPTEPLSLLKNGEMVDSLILQDDGTDGDAVPGDGWFTVDGLVLPPGSRGVATSTLAGFSSLHEPDVAHGGAAVQLRVSFRTADQSVVGLPMVTQPASDARATSRVVALVHPDARNLQEEGLERIVRRYYELFPADRDFLVVLAPPTVGPGWSARAYQIQNDVAGLGLDLAQWRDFGVQRLSLVVHARMAFYSSRGNFCLLNHELSHRWIAYAGPPLADGMGHWLTELDRMTSALGDPIGCLMNDLELYLAGLVPADSVQDPLGRNGYTMAEFLTGLGARDPEYGTAATDFTIGFVVAHDTPLADHELAYFHYIAGEYTAASSDLAPNWSAATGGRSRLKPDASALGAAGRHEAAMR